MDSSPSTTASRGGSSPFPLANQGSLLVSIIVSTYRRTDVLPEALVSLRHMELRPGLAYEVLVVDNDPQQSARQIVAAEQPQWCEPRSLRYIHEPQAGLSYVRNRGMDEALGDIVGFLDDDIFISPNWLNDIVGVFERTGADCVGARTVVHWDGQPEPAVLACQDSLVNNAMPGEEFEVRGDCLFGGGNMAIRRSLVDEGFRFDHGLGRIGNVLLSGEDTEAIRRLRDGGKRLWFCGSAVMHHRTGGERLTAAYYIRRAYWMGLSYALVDRYTRGKTLQMASALLRFIKTVLVTAPAWYLARLRGDAASELLQRVALNRQLGYIHITLQPGKLLQGTSSAAPKAPQTVA